MRKKMAIWFMKEQETTMNREKVFEQLKEDEGVVYAIKM